MHNESYLLKHKKFIYLVEAEHLRMDFNRVSQVIG